MHLQRIAVPIRWTAQIRLGQQAVCGVVLLAALAAAAQTAPKHRKPRVVAPKPAVQAQPASVPVAPPAPVWPANENPLPATVEWQNNTLRVVALNSSLQQILTDVAAKTGTTVDGLGGDQRIFGTFGPAKAREVLAQLLQGSGLNIVMVGDQGNGVPRQLLLSQRNHAGGPGNPMPAMARPAQPEPDDDDNNDAVMDTQPEPPPMPTPQNAPGNQPPNRTPQEMMQEMQMRQQQMQQNQQTPQNNPQ